MFYFPIWRRLYGGWGWFGGVNLLDSRKFIYKLAYWLYIYPDVGFIHSSLFNGKGESNGKDVGEKPPHVFYEWEIMWNKMLHVTLNSRKR